MYLVSRNTQQKCAAIPWSRRGFSMIHQRLHFLKVAPHSSSHDVATFDLILSRLDNAHRDISRPVHLEVAQFDDRPFGKINSTHLPSLCHALRLAGSHRNAVQHRSSATEIDSQGKTNRFVRKYDINFTQLSITPWSQSPTAWNGYPHHCRNKRSDRSAK